MGFFPVRPAGGVEDGDFVEVTDRERTLQEEEQLAHVEAAGRRACEIAARVFGSVSASSLTGTGIRGPFSGLLRLDVPFRTLSEHRAREARFLEAVAEDALLAHVPLLFVVGPDGA